MTEMLTTKQTAEYFSLSKGTVLSRVKEMQNHVGQGKRYPASALIVDGRITRIDKNAFADFLNTRSKL